MLVYKEMLKTLESKSYNQFKNKSENKKALKFFEGFTKSSSELEIADFTNRVYFLMTSKHASKEQLVELLDFKQSGFMIKSSPNLLRDIDMLETSFIGDSEGYKSLKEKGLLTQLSPEKRSQANTGLIINTIKQGSLLPLERIKLSVFNSTTNNYTFLLETALDAYSENMLKLFARTAEDFSLESQELGIQIFGKLKIDLGENGVSSEYIREPNAIELEDLNNILMIVLLCYWLPEAKGTNEALVGVDTSELITTIVALFKENKTQEILDMLKLPEHIDVGNIVFENEQDVSEINTFFENISKETLDKLTQTALKNTLNCFIQYTLEILEYQKTYNLIYELEKLIKRESTLVLDTLKDKNEVIKTVRYLKGE